MPFDRVVEQRAERVGRHVVDAQMTLCAGLDRGDCAMLMLMPRQGNDRPFVERSDQPGERFSCLGDTGAGFEQYEARVRVVVGHFEGIGFVEVVAHGGRFEQSEEVGRKVIASEKQYRMPCHQPRAISTGTLAP